MTTVNLQISDDIIKAYGLEAIQKRLMRFLEWERLVLSAKKIQSAVNEAGIDNDELWREARQKAWDNFKSEKLKDILP